MPTCVVPTCKNAAGIKKKKGITFHLFPADEQRKSEWTKIIQRARLDEFWKPSKRSLVCSIHFEQEYFYDTKGGLRRLKRKAVPNKHIAVDKCGSFKETAKPSTSEYDMAIEECKVKKETPGSPTLEDGTPPQSPIRSDSEIDDLFEAPRILKLKSQLLHKEKMCQKYCRQIRTLQQKNRRLSKRNQSLKHVIRNLQNNPYVNGDHDNKELAEKSMDI